MVYRTDFIEYLLIDDLLIISHLFAVCSAVILIPPQICSVAIVRLREACKN